MAQRASVFGSGVLECPQSRANRTGQIPMSGPVRAAAAPCRTADKRDRDAYVDQSLDPVKDRQIAAARPRRRESTSCLRTDQTRPFAEPKLQNELIYLL